MLLPCLMTLWAVQAQSAELTAYLDLAEATLARPVTVEELRQAALSAEGLATIRELFERSLDSGLALDDAFVTPELGGEAMIADGKIDFVVYPDPVHPAIREMVTRSNDPAALLRHLESSETGRFLLENSGGLHALLYRLSREAPSAADHSLLRDVVANTVATHFKTWTTDPSIQAEMIEQTSWRGRYVGFWHLHPPRVSGETFGEGIEPSPADRRNALELGQFVTVVFQPNGFDLYDLSPLARGDTTPLKPVRYRALEWRDHFLARLRAAQGSSVP